MVLLRKPFLSFLLLCILLLNGCSSGPTHYVVSDANVNFKNLSSFSLFARSSSFYNSQNISDASRNRIENAIEIGMEKQGLEYLSAEDADIIVSYFVVGRGSLKRYNRAVRFCQHCNQEQRELESMRQYEPGSIVLDALDTGKQKSIWRSVIKPAFKPNKKTSLYKQEKAVKEAILGALAGFPNVQINKAS